MLALMMVSDQVLRSISWIQSQQKEGVSNSKTQYGR
jgi:hypothetical protein